MEYGRKNAWKNFSELSDHNAIMMEINNDLDDRTLLINSVKVQDISRDVARGNCKPLTKPGKPVKTGKISTPKDKFSSAITIKGKIYF